MMLYYMLLFEQDEQNTPSLNTVDDTFDSDMGDIDDSDIPADESTDMSVAQDDTVITSLKKFDLLNKMNLLRTRLKYHGYNCEDLDTVLSFAAFISYPTLLKIFGKILNTLLPIVQNRHKRGEDAIQ